MNCVNGKVGMKTDDVKFRDLTAMYIWSFVPAFNILLAWCVFHAIFNNDHDKQLFKTIMRFRKQLQNL